MQVGDSLEVYKLNDAGQLEFVLGKLGDSETVNEESVFSFYVNAGEQYRVDIAASDPSASNTMSLKVAEDETVRPQNDDFETAYRLGVINTQTDGTNLHATSQLGEPLITSTNPPQRSVWWKWTAPANGILSLSASSLEMDTTLALFAGWTLDDLISMCENNNENPSTTNSALSFEVSQGIEYSILVSGNEGSQGAFSLALDFQTLSQKNKPANDDFSLATKLSGYFANSYGHNRLASEEVNEEILSYNQSKPINSVWWNWHSPANGNARVSLAGSAFDTLLKAFEGNSLSNLILIAENDDYEGESTSEVEFYAEAGKIYYFSVDGFEASSGEIAIALSLAEVVTQGPDNDSKKGARSIDLFPAGISGTNIGATGKKGEFSDEFEGTILPSVWWKWKPDQDVHVAIDTTGSDIDTLLEIFTENDNGKLVSVGQSDDFFGSSSLVHFLAFSQSEYYILVAGRSAEEGLIVLNLNGVEANGSPVSDETIRNKFESKDDQGEWTNNLIVIEEPEKETETSKFYTIENVPSG